MTMSSRGPFRYSIELSVTLYAQLGRLWRAVSSASRASLTTFAAMVLLAGSATAQQPPPVVGNIEGDNVSIAPNASAATVLQSSTATNPIANGGVVMVGPGEARLMLTLGGELDICGPAKFTLLQSGEAMTVALEFGTIRLELPASANLRVFTPTMIATPVEINGAPGDATVRLEQDDSLGVRAASGALLLESQFTNEKIVVPQAGQFFFAQGRLAPVARTDLQCECVLNEARFVPPPSPAPAIPAVALSPAQIAAAEKANAPTPEIDNKADDSAVEYSVLAHPNDAHPLSSEPKTAPPPPPDLMPVYQIDMPPLAFSASSPVAPPLPAENMVLLIRTTQIDPDFEFTGHVDPPRIDQRPTIRATKAPQGRQPKIAGAKPGFWARFKHFLVGSSS